MPFDIPHIISCLLSHFTAKALSSQPCTIDFNCSQLVLCASVLANVSLGKALLKVD